MSILGRLQERLRERTSRPAADIRVELPVTLSPRLRARIQQRVNGKKTHQPRVVTVRGEDKVFYFRSAWSTNEIARRRRKSKAARIARRANR